MNKTAFAISYILLLITAISALATGLLSSATVALGVITSLAFAWAYGTYGKEVDEDEVKAFSYAVATLAPITSFLTAGLYYSGATMLVQAVGLVLGFILLTAHLIAMVMIGYKEKLPIWCYAAPFTITFGALEPYITYVSPSASLLPGFAILLIIGALLALLGLFLKKE